LLKFGTGFYHVIGDTLQFFKVKGQGQRHNITSTVKRYKAAMDKLTDFNYGMVS